MLGTRRIEWIVTVVTFLRKNFDSHLIQMLNFNFINIYEYNCFSIYISRLYVGAYWEQIRQEVDGIIYRSTIKWTITTVIFTERPKKIWQSQLRLKKIITAKLRVAWVMNLVLANGCKTVSGNAFTGALRTGSCGWYSPPNWYYYQHSFDWHE